MTTPATWRLPPSANSLERGYYKAKVNWQFLPTSHSRYDLVLSVTPGTNPKVRAHGDTSLHPPKVFAASAIDTYAARLTSHYIATGYYDATVTVTQEIRDKEAHVNFAVNRGTYYHPIDTKTICGCLFRQRREAEKPRHRRLQRVDGPIRRPGGAARQAVHGGAYHFLRI